MKLTKWSPSTLGRIAQGAMPIALRRHMWTQAILEASFSGSQGMPIQTGLHGTRRPACD
jgi:hypothetical protein